MFLVYLKHINKKDGIGQTCHLNLSICALYTHMSFPLWFPVRFFLHTFLFFLHCCSLAFVVDLEDKVSGAARSVHFARRLAHLRYLCEVGALEERTVRTAASQCRDFKHTFSCWIEKQIKGFNNIQKTGQIGRKITCMKKY